MFNDLMKHQSMSKISNLFVQGLRNNYKYKSKLTNGEYIIERFLDKGINNCFLPKNSNHTPFLKISNKFNTFNIIQCNTENESGYCALSFTNNTKLPGLMLSTSTNGYRNLTNIFKNASRNNYPMIFLSFFDRNSTIKVNSCLQPQQKFIKQSYTVLDYKTSVPNLLEYMLFQAELPRKGPVHINICNDLLNTYVCFDKIKQNTMSRDEELHKLENEYKSIYATKSNNDVGRYHIQQNTLINKKKM